VNKLWYSVGRNSAWTKAYDGADDEDGAQHCGRPGPNQEIVTDQ